jgi:hypothetical protein
MQLVNYHFITKNNNMSIITFECDVTEFDSIPQLENDANEFILHDKSLIIKIKDTNLETTIISTEIEAKNAVQLAKMILLKYDI